MRICFILPSAYGIFAPDVEAYGGGVRQLGMISRGLADEFDVHFVVGDYGQPKTEIRDGVTIHRSYKQSQETPALQKPVQLLRLRNAMKRANADVYIYRGAPYKAAVTYTLARTLRSRWVYSIRNDTNLGADAATLPPLVRQLYERALRRADAVIAQTDKQARVLRDTRDVSATVIPSGYPRADSILPYDEREDVIWVGRLRQDQKRPHLYLDVAERCPDTSFLLIGPEGFQPAYNDRIRSRVATLDNLTYVGPVDPDEIHDYYRRAIALVNTSAYEGFPSTFLEAWRYGTPVLSLDVVPTRYTDIDDRRGFADGDVQTLAELVQCVASDPSERARIGEPMHEYFEANLTIEQVVNQYAELLRSIST